MIRKANTPALRAAVSAEIALDWIHLPVPEIEARLIDIAGG
jgi:hypothetical protein